MVFPTLPVTATTGIESSFIMYSAISNNALTTLFTRIIYCSCLISTSFSAKQHIAPASNAFCIKSCPSTLSPTMGAKISPSFTFRESLCSPVACFCNPFFSPINVPFTISAIFCNVIGIINYPFQKLFLLLLHHQNVLFCLQKFDNFHVLFQQ